MSKRTIIALAVMLLMILIPSIGAVTSAQGEPIKIGGIHPLSGRFSADGINMDNAIQMAIDEINASGGLLGGTALEYLSADSTGAANTGQSEAERLIGEGAAALICCFQSDVAARVAAVADSANVPLVIDVGVADAITEQGFDYVFRLQPNATTMGADAADYLVEFSESLGDPVESIVYLHEGTTDFGRSVSAAFVDRAEQIGLEVLDIIPYDVTATDLTTEMTLVNSMAPDVLVVTGYYSDGLLIARNAEEVGLDVKAIYGVAQGTYDQPQFMRDERGSAECFFNANFHWGAANRAGQAVRDTYENLFNDSMRPGSMFAYQSVYIIADAISRAGSADPSAIRDALASTNYQNHLLSYDGAIRFDANGDVASAAPVLTQVLDGEILQVWPEAGAEADPVYPCTSWGYLR